MDRLIYSKFSNERNSKYAIETSIVENDGARWVCKKPLYEEGKQHFENMKTAYWGLVTMFPKGELAIQPYEKASNGLRFPYVEGTDMESLLHDTYNSQGYEAVLRRIKEYFDMIKKYSSTEMFEKTNEFVQMFGDFNFPQETKCGKFNNLDYGFANVIVSENRQTLIDYEWTMDFPIPLEFLLYRALHYYVYTCPESVALVKNGIFEDLGFDEENIEKYLKMEQNFQNYISSGNVSLGELHESMGQKTYNIHELYSEYCKNETPSMQVYYDYGEGFLHENSYFIKPEIDENGKETIYIKDIPKNALRVRIDPRKECSILSLIEFTADNDKELQEIMDTNACEINDDNIYVFDVVDPWFVVKNENFSNIVLSVSGKTEKYIFKVATQIRENRNLRDKVNIVEKEYNEVINSTSWKITEPLRKLRNR
ncbi:hypothetical protein [Agathobacter sp.]